MGKIVIEGYECERCGHQWVRRSTITIRDPVICPKCKSPYWNRPRVNPKLEKAVVDAFKNKDEDKMSE